MINYLITFQTITTNLIDSVQAEFLFLCFLMVLCIILTLKSNVPILNGVVGMLALGLIAYTLPHNTMLFYGLIQFTTLITALLCMMSGYRQYRS